MSSFERIIVEEMDDVLCIRFLDQTIMDENQIQTIGRELMSLLPRSKLMINFSGLHFMSSAMIGKLYLLHTTMRNAQEKLVMCSIEDNVLEVFKITKLNKVFSIRSDEEAAFREFRK